MSKMNDLISRGAVIEVLKQTGIIQDNDLGHLVVDEINRIPSRVIPDKYEGWYLSDRARGWNACIDKILGGEDNG